MIIKRVRVFDRLCEGKRLSERLRILADYLDGDPEAWDSRYNLVKHYLLWLLNR